MKKFLTGLLLIVSTGAVFAQDATSEDYEPARRKMYCDSQSLEFRPGGGPDKLGSCVRAGTVPVEDDRLGVVMPRQCERESFTLKVALMGRHSSCARR